MAEADEQLFCDLYGDADTMRFIGPPLLRDRAARGFRSVLKLIRRPDAGQAFFTLCDSPGGAAIGICSIQHIDVAKCRAEAGIMIAATHRDRRFAKEGLTGLIQFAFDTLSLDEVWVQIHADHTVVEKLVVSVGLSRSQASEPQSGDQESHPMMNIWSVRRADWPAYSATSKDS